MILGVISKRVSNNIYVKEKDKLMKTGQRGRGKKRKFGR